MLNDPKTYCYDYTMLLAHNATCYANGLASKEQVLEAIEIYAKQAGYYNLFVQVALANAVVKIDNPLEAEWLLHAAAIKGEERFTDLVTSSELDE